MKQIFDIVYGNYGEEEYVEEYEELDDARADFNRISQYENYDFVFLRHIKIDEEDEDITIICSTES